MNVDAQSRDRGTRAVPEITSARSGRVRAARRLAKRAHRVQERRFLAEGPQAVGEAANEPNVLEDIFVTAEAAARYATLLGRAAEHGTQVHQVSGEVMNELAQTITPQGLIGVCRFVDRPLDAIASPAPRLVAVLTHVRDPGNAGTVIRAADAAGAGAVIVTDASVDVYNAKCVRASAGSVFHVPIAAGVPVAQAVAVLRAGGMRIVAADSHGERDLDAALDGGELAPPTAWLFGNEAWGLPDAVRELADDVVRVPIYGRAESLNLAAAAAVCLYASARAHRDAMREQEQ